MVIFSVSYLCPVYFYAMFVMHVCSNPMFVFLQVFSQMVFVGVTFSFSCLVQVLAACVQEIELNLSKIANPGPKDDPVTLQVSQLTVT